MRKAIYTEVEVEINLTDFDDIELLEEVERRQLDTATTYVHGHTIKSLLTQVWLKRRSGQDFSYELDQLIYYGLGRVL